MNLSPHFDLPEFLRSDTALRLGIDMTPPPPVVAALTALAVNVLEPLRAHLGAPIHITSGYRPLRLNTAIGGALTSQHMVGQAADIYVTGMTPPQLCRAIIAFGVPFDQCISEFGWTHVSFNPAGKQRGQVLTAFHRPGGGVGYRPGLPE
ncbi:MAG: peptidase M15A [Proteobacteria bacterium]|nr:peptidase M15A [Pseudomonadota bacterium]